MRERDLPRPGVRRSRRSRTAARKAAAREAARRAAERKLAGRKLAAPGTAGRRADARRSPGRRLRRGPPPGLYFGAATVLVLGLVAGATVMIVRGRSGPPVRDAPVRRPVATGVAPAAYSDAPSARVFAAIDRRSADANPLTVREVFPAKALRDRDARARLTLADAQLDGDCAAAIWGLELGEELWRAGCTQVVRGAYIDKKAGYAAMVAIFNLAGATQANRIVDAIGSNSVPGFILPLARGDRFDQGFSLARGRAMGHYGVIGWVRRLDGGGDEQDTPLLSLLIAVESPRAVLNRAAAARTAAAPSTGAGSTG